MRQILKDIQYIGVYVAGRTERTEVASKKHINKKENDWIKIPDHHPAIVDKTLFDAVQIALKEKPEPIRQRAIGTYEHYGNIDNPLKGKVVCGCCKHNDLSGLFSTSFLTSSGFSGVRIGFLPGYGFGK